MRTYELDMPFLVRLFPFLILSLMTIFPLIEVGRGEFPPFVLILFSGVVGWNWWVVLTLVYKVNLHDDGSVEWVSLIKKMRTPPEELREIGPDRMGTAGFFTVKSNAGKMRFINQITGFHEVLLHIKGRNPSVVIRGC